MLSPNRPGSRLLAMASIAAALLTLAGCSQEEAQTRPIIRPVKTVEIVPANETRTLSYSGSVRARVEMNLGFRISGKISERLVDIGQKVRSGDLLARIDAADYQLSLKSAEANLDSAERQVETTALERSRAEELFAKNVYPKSQLEQALLGYNQAVAARNAAMSALEQAKNQVSYAELRSDRNGIVTAINADVGQVVSAGTPVVTVAVDGEKEVVIAVPETDVAEFSPGKAVRASFWSNDGLTLQGRVREVAGSADPQSRTFSVRVSLPADPRVLLGMTANIEATADGAPALVLLPLSALSSKDDQTIVWTVDRAAQTVHARPVRIDGFTADGARISDGLAPGDVVVAAGTQFMTEGLTVKFEAPGSRQAAASGDATGLSTVTR